MVEIGAGGGSIAAVDAAGRLTVGPHSAGSEPGPAAYGRGGTRPTLTDADLAMGRIDPAAFAGGKVTLDIAASNAALAGLGLWGGDPSTLALGVSEIVDETMASAARVHAVEQGTTLEERCLIAFGGAAPLHAARIAEKLGIGEVVIPSGAGVGSAVGFLRAPVSYEVARSLRQRLDTLELDRLNALLDGMTAEARTLVEAGAPGKPQVEQRVCLARYQGQGYEIPFGFPTGSLGEDAGETLREAFEAAYRAQYGGLTLDLPIEAVTWRVTVGTAAWAPTPIEPPADAGLRLPERHRDVIDPNSGQRRPFALFAREALGPGDRVAGPALIVERETTTIVSGRFDASIDARGYIVLTRREEADAQ